MAYSSKIQGFSALEIVATETFAVTVDLGLQSHAKEAVFLIDSLGHATADKIVVASVSDEAAASFVGYKSGAATVGSADKFTLTVSNTPATVTQHLIQISSSPFRYVKLAGLGDASDIKIAIVGIAMDPTLEQPWADFRQEVVGIYKAASVPSTKASYAGQAERVHSVN